MKKIFILALIAATIISCKNGKAKEENKTTDEKTTTATAATGNDAVLTDWLKGKILTADDPKLDYNNFKLLADGTCEDKGGAKVSWTIEEGKLNMGGLMKIAIEKKDETTLIMHRSLSDETYKVSALP
jgi:hypothetical protein